MEFNVNLFKYYLTERVIKMLQERGATQIIFAPTCQPDSMNFYANMSVNDKQAYAKFGEEIMRLSFFVNGTNVGPFYFIFRNCKRDIDADHYCFTSPSSLEFGNVDSNGGFTSLYKTHYTDWIKVDNSTTIIPGITYDPVNKIIIFSTQEDRNVMIRKMTNGIIAQLAINIYNLYNLSIAK